MDSVTIQLGAPQGAKGTAEFTKTARLAFEANYLETFLLPEGDGIRLLVGLGDRAIGSLERQELYATVSKAFRKHKIDSFSVAGDMALTGDNGLRDAALGLTLGQYECSIKNKAKRPCTIGITGVDNLEAMEEINAGINLAVGIGIARDLVFLPANMLRPEDMAARITNELSPLGVECKTFSSEKLTQMGMNGLLEVGKGSDYPPCMLVMRHRGGGKEDPVGLVGKGVTFDSGGYCLKDKGGVGCKADMAGAAAVVAAMYAVAKNKLPANVVAVIPMCENRISGNAVLAGDVYTAYSGKTVEVLNTDAEGRLILGDAVAYAIKDEKARCIVDIATLTGASSRALGPYAAAAVSNSATMWEKLQAAAVTVGERFWLWPDYPEYHKLIESTIADVKNIGPDSAGGITGGLFIGYFAGDTPWVHLDIAGTGWSDPPIFAFHTNGPTGMGAATMYQLCVNESKA